MTVVEILIEASEEALSVIRDQDRALGNPYDPESMSRLREAIAAAKKELAHDRHP